jgi:epoxyqueuosine reductase
MDSFFAGGYNMADSEISSDEGLGELTETLLSQGAAIVGAADLSRIDPELRQGLPTGVSIAVPIAPDIVAGIKDGPTSVYYEEYKRLNELLGRLAAVASECISKRGHGAMAFTATNVDYDPRTLMTRLPHKTVATRAGLGWIGKTALLVTKSFGPAIRLTTVLTDAVFPYGKPIDASRCGDCRVCVDVCPAHAAKGMDWNIDTGRDSFFDAAACRRMARELSARIGVDQSCCGMCVAACPWTQAYIRRNR